MKNYSGNIFERTKQWHKYYRRSILFMKCTLCKTEIEAEHHIRNDHVYHEGCVKIYDKGETDDAFTLTN